MPDTNPPSPNAGTGFPVFASSAKHLFSRDAKNDSRRVLFVALPVRQAAARCSFRLKLPYLFARLRNQRVDIFTRIEIHHAVDHQRRAFGIHVAGGIAHVKRPRPLKLLYIVPIDLRKRGVAHRSRIVTSNRPVRLRAKRHGKAENRENGETDDYRAYGILQVCFRETLLRCEQRVMSCSICA